MFLPLPNHIPKKGQSFQLRSSKSSKLKFEPLEAGNTYKASTSVNASEFRLTFANESANALAEVLRNKFVPLKIDSSARRVNKFSELEMTAGVTIGHSNGVWIICL